MRVRASKEHLKELEQKYDMLAYSPIPWVPSDPETDDDTTYYLYGLDATYDDDLCLERIVVRQIGDATTAVVVTNEDLAFLMPIETLEEAIQTLIESSQHAVEQYNKEWICGKLSVTESYVLSFIHLSECECFKEKEDAPNEGLQQR